jgi:quercetin dioxygenase-like cupin family protein
MMIGDEKEVIASTIQSHEAKNAALKVLISPREGWEDYVMRIVELGEGGYSPAHAHPWPHINYVLAGEGVLQMDGRDSPVGPGAYAYVPAGRPHQYRNTGKEPLRFMCIVPREGHVV